mgnify:CR=1 FL=1
MMIVYVLTKESQIWIPYITWVYIDDFIINVSIRPKHTQNHLKTENLDSTKFSICLQVKYSLKNTYQSTYIQNIYEKFTVDISYQ